ncbi:MAG: hypothetical protein UHO61_06240 [Acutalibacteraceae bacterium]|nr:hypothetical protein [Acutalibacteraceae bacterium]
MCKVLAKASYCSMSDASYAPCYCCASKGLTVLDTAFAAVSFFIVNSAIFLKIIINRITIVKEKQY